MSTSTPSFDYDPSLQEYAVHEKEFLRQHPRYSVLCTGIVVFHENGKLLLVQRAADEKAFPNAWEVPGGKVDDTDESILHAAVRELKEETGLKATRILRKVGESEFSDRGRHGPEQWWLKTIFEMEVQSMDALVLDPIEHQAHLFASEEDVVNNCVGDLKMVYMPQPSKEIKLEAFRLRQEALPK
ncbi:hypothetical protein P153DRAFT_370362 [Dothidotthia symphoricarpi CBS 119687]|uniref:Nudix hydrolase domain-containing protein n=1 Tax=Dothidotthia symphoricarpi CBS 119687 TaxID=1392245 RepID=A0A6A5ZZ77_9PLEO|nr:uncharacterized protein P153DRAFT_370362 [Dothidotthia symphoricarpi CBS 119687]KAF2125042.1 hypothetical protein P153DRAFT_370362 [Dothidotthia symphoricarpi CBS 119687]